MTVEAIPEGGVAPPPSRLTVAAAYEAVKALLQIGERYTIEWVNDGYGITQRFADGPFEAWLWARPVDEEGKRRPGAPHPIAVVHLRSGGARTQQRLRSELAALIEADEFEWRSQA